MLVSCRCGKEIITEADVHVVIPALDYEINCCCFILEELEEVKNPTVAEHLREKVKIWNARS